MLAAQYDRILFANAAIQKNELLEIHRSKISLHHAKDGYDTLPPEKKNAVDEWVGLRWRRAKPKTRFGA